MAGWPIRKNDASGVSLVFPIYDADGDLVSSAAALDSEISKDGGAFADVTAEATEIGTSGIYSLALAQAEINANYIVTITKTTTTGAKTAVNVVYTSTRNIDDLAISSDILALNDIASSDVQAELVTYDAATGTEVAALNDIAASDIWDALSSDYAVATTFGAYLDAAISALNDIASSDVQAELVTYDAATGTEVAALNDISASDIWDALSSDFAVATSFGAYLDSSVSGASGAPASDVWAFATRVLTAGDNLNDLAASDIQAELVTYDAATGTEVAALNDLAASDIWDALSSDYAVGTSFGAYLDAAISGATGDPSSDIWAFATRVLTAGTNLNDIASSDVQAELVTYGAGLASDLADVKVDTAAILADTGSDGVVVASIAVDAITASALNADAALEIADAILKRDLDQVEATMALHSLGTAALKAVSKIIDDAGTLKLYRTDGSTLHMSQTVTTDSGLDPIDALTVGA